MDKEAGHYEDCFKAATGEVIYNIPDIGMAVLEFMTPFFHLSL